MKATIFHISFIALLLLGLSEAKSKSKISSTDEEESSKEYDLTETKFTDS